MTENRLRNQIGIYIIMANIIVVVVTAALYFIGGFLYDEMTTTIALLIPMFSVYTTAIVKSFVANRLNIEDKSPTVSAQYRFISWLFPVSFTLWLVGIVFLKAFNVGFNSFEQFKGMLIASESIFGVYVGMVLSSMFNITKRQSSSSKGSGGTA